VEHCHPSIHKAWFGPTREADQGSSMPWSARSLEHLPISLGDKSRLVRLKRARKRLHRLHTDAMQQLGDAAIHQKSGL